MDLNKIYELEEIRVKLPITDPFPIDNEKIVFQTLNLEPFAVIHTEAGYALVCPQYPQQLSSYPYAMCAQAGEDTVVTETTSIFMDLKRLLTVSKRITVWFGVWSYESAVYNRALVNPNIDVVLRPKDSSKGWRYDPGLPVLPPTDTNHNSVILFQYDITEAGTVLSPLVAKEFALKVLDPKHILHSAGISLA